MAAFALAFIFMGIFLLGIIVFSVITWWKLFEKAGKPGWIAVVPIYSTVVLLEIVGKPTWWIFLLFIPGINLIFGIWTINLLSKSFGKDEGYTIGILLLGIVFLPMLAFGDAQYIGPMGDANFQFASTTYSPVLIPSTNKDLYSTNN